MSNATHWIVALDRAKDGGTREAGDRWWHFTKVQAVRSLQAAAYEVARGCDDWQARGEAVEVVPVVRDGGAWREVKPAIWPSEDLSERAKRILGDLGDGSPIGDMTAALDEVERLRAAEDGERAAVVAWLRGQNRAGESIVEVLRIIADAIERGEHRGGEVICG